MSTSWWVPMSKLVVGLLLFSTTFACVADVKESLVVPTFSNSELFNMADVIVYGQVVEISPDEIGCVLALFRLRITKVIKGDVAIGDEVLVGLTSASPYMNRENEHVLLKVGNDKEFISKCDRTKVGAISNFDNLFIAIGEAALQNPRARKK